MKSSDVRSFVISVIASLLSAGILLFFSRYLQAVLQSAVVLNTLVWGIAVIIGLVCYFFVRPRMRIWDLPTYEIHTSTLPGRIIDFGVRPIVLRIAGRKVRAEDLPANIHVAGAHLVIRKFTETGMLFDERGTAGVVVRIRILKAA